MVELKCQSCGGNMQLTPSRLADCPFCGSRVVFDSAVLGNLDAAARGDVLLQLQEYDRAAQAYEEAISTRPNDYKGWRGKLWMFLAGQDNNYAGVAKYSENMRKLVPASEKETLLEESKQKVVAAVEQAGGLVTAFTTFVQQQMQALDSLAFVPNTPADQVDLRQQKKQWAEKNKPWLVRRGWAILLAIPFISFFGALITFSSGPGSMLAGTILFILLPLAFVGILIATIVLTILTKSRASTAALENWQSTRRRLWMNQNITDTPYAKAVANVREYLDALLPVSAEYAPECVKEINNLKLILQSYSFLA